MPIDRPQVELWFELEPDCNWNCKFCYNSWRSGAEPAPARRSTADIISSLNTVLSRTSCRSLVFSGGEPLLRGDIVDILDGIRCHNVPTALTTNGSLLTPDKISALLRAGVQSIVVSLHSHLEDRHNELTGGSFWRGALNGILQLREAGADVAVVFVATRRNLCDFPRVIELCGLIGVKRVIFNRFVPAGQGALFRDELGVPTDEELVPVLDAAVALAGAYGLRVDVGVPVDVHSAEAAGGAGGIECGSCVVRSGQVRWTLGVDLQFRRCNLFRSRAAPSLESGLDLVTREAGERAMHGREEGRDRLPCKILVAHERSVEDGRSRGE